MLYNGAHFQPQMLASWFQYLQRQKIKTEGWRSGSSGEP
jgi:hypothetical protein